ncbi:MAG: hypothetical protein ABEJ56_01300 [Candidatus Nanohaloarchaea archaeon]
MRKLLVLWVLGLLITVPIAAQGQNSYPDCSEGEVILEPLDGSTTSDYPAEFRGCIKSGDDIDRIYTIVKQTDRLGSTIPKTSEHGVLYQDTRFSSDLSGYCTGEGCSIGNQKLSLEKDGDQIGVKLKLNGGKSIKDGVVMTEAVLIPNEKIPLGGKPLEEKMRAACGKKGSECIDGAENSYDRATLRVGGSSFKWGSRFTVRPGMTIDLSQGNTGCSGTLDVTSSANYVHLKFNSKVVRLTDKVHAPDQDMPRLGENRILSGEVTGGVKVTHHESGEGTTADITLECIKEEKSSSGRFLELSRGEVTLGQKITIRVKNTDAEQLKNGWKVLVKNPGGKRVGPTTGWSPEKIEFSPRKTGSYSVMLKEKPGTLRRFFAMINPWASIDTIEKAGFSVSGDYRILKACPVEEGSSAVKSCLENKCGGNIPRSYASVKQKSPECRKLVGSACSYAVTSVGIESSSVAACDALSNWKARKGGGGSE